MKRPLRIAIFVGSFPVVSETFILRQITALLDLGHDVDIYADTRAESGTAVQPEVERHQLPSRTTFMDIPPEAAPWEMPVWPLTGKTWPPGSPAAIPNWQRAVRVLPRLGRSFMSMPRLTRQVLSRTEYGYQAASLSALYRLTRLQSINKRYDVLHAHFGPVGNSFRFACRLWRAPLVVSFHGYDFTTVPRQQGPSVYEKLFIDAQIITANSNYMGEKLQSLGCPPEKIRKLSYGIDLEKFKFRARNRTADEPFRIVTTGRLVEKKGMEYVLRAVARAARKHPGLRCDIIGDGPLRGQLQKLAVELSVDQMVQFHGALNGDAVRSLLDRAHVFVLASVTARDGDQEGAPVSILEAQAVGLPVISTRHSGIPEIMPDGQSGWLVPERDSDALAERLNQLLESPQLSDSFGIHGRRFVEAHFSSALCINVLLDIYTELRERYSQ
ncbi:MAG TPA: glycosyltransferase [Candidatus Angelobacter sp.]|nr:glycosyltransferase [Candidatus Angelobacter sp.]